MRNHALAQVIGTLVDLQSLAESAEGLYHV